MQQALEELGEIYRKDVSLLMPNPKYANRIESQVRENRPLWNHIRKALPGLLISTVPFAKLNDLSEECYFIPFDTKNIDSIDKVAETIIEVRSLIDEELSIKLTNYDNEVSSIYRRIGKSIELKPGLFGFSIDLKELFGSWKSV